MQKQITRKHYLIALVVIIILYLLFRIPAFLEPLWEGDHGMYLAVAHAMLQGHILYKQVWDIKPPTIYFLYITFYHFFGLSALPFKIFTFILNSLDLLLLYALGKAWFKEYKNSFFLTIIAIPAIILFYIFQINFIDAETYFVFFTLFSVFLLRKLDHEQNPLMYLCSGILIGIALTFKLSVSFDIIAIISSLSIFFIIRYIRTRDKKALLLHIRNIGVYIIGIMLPMASYALYFMKIHAFHDFTQAVFVIYRAYIKVYETKILGITTTKFNIMIFLLLFSLLIWVYIKKRKELQISKPLFFIFLWSLCTIYLVFLSGRPYAHYWIQTIPALTFLLGWVMYTISVKKAVITVFAILLITTYFARGAGETERHDWFSWYPHYYIESYAYIFHRTSKEQYTHIFPGLNQYTDLITYINAHYTTHDSIYVWGEAAWVYAATKLDIKCRLLNDIDVNIVPHGFLDTYTCIKQNHIHILIDTPTTYIFSEIKRLEKTDYTLIKKFNNGTIALYQRK